MRAVDIIQRKRDGQELAPEEIDFFIQGYAQGQIPDYQASALAMAVFFKGMTPVETLALTESMMRSGEVLDLSFLPGPKADKHSTGGVGDKTSLVLAPLAAASGVYVPMISGRGLGHTGGTLDKLEAIPGFRVNLSLAEFRAVLKHANLGLIGQTPQISPADRKLYALRDVTATVESLPLISASIMSKKMAEGIDALVLDVKTGDGAFMRSFEESKALAQAMVTIGRGMGKKVVALITDMDQPLGHTAGNALEVVECIETLKGRGPKDLESLSLELAAWMLFLGASTPSLDEARHKVRAALTSGAGLRKLQQAIELQGGDPRVCDDPARLPRARETTVVKAQRDGRVAKIGCRSVGHAAMLLGAGRETVASVVDPAVGLTLHKKVGDLVMEGEPLVTVHFNDRRRLEESLSLLRQSFTVAAEAPLRKPMIQAAFDLMLSAIGDAVRAIEGRTPLRPRIGLVLGSGLGAFARTLEQATAIPYRELPHFPVSTAIGHQGELVVGLSGSVPVAVMAGRVHYYEGYTPAQVVFPIRVLGRFGIETAILTNAAGSVNVNYKPGELMVIEDHINYMGMNPLVGPNEEALGQRFFDVSEAYDPGLRQIAEQVCEKVGITVRKGVYIAFTGPSYETPAEIRMARTLGADAVGMSTVPEVLAARHMGIRVLGLSCITNMAAGILKQELDHREVLQVAEQVKASLLDVLGLIVQEAAKRT